MKHYVYKITDSKTNEFYYGSRSHIEPNNDTYMGSMKIWKPENVNRLRKEIIKDDFISRDDAVYYESLLIKTHIDNELNRNYHIPNKGFHVTGIPKTIQHRDKLSKIRINNKLSEGCNNPMYSKKHSDLSINKMKEIAKGRYTIGWFIKKYGDEIGVYMYNEKKQSHSIKISGKQHPMYGKYGVDNPNYGRIVSEDVKTKISKAKSKKILQFSLDNIFIREWDSAREASIYYKIHINTIYNNLMQKRPNGAGFIWKYS